MSDKARCHDVLDQFGLYGTLTIVGTGSDYRISERRIIKVADLTPRQRQLIAELVAEFSATKLTIIAPPSKEGLKPDRVEVLTLRR